MIVVHLSWINRSKIYQKLHDSLIFVSQSILFRSLWTVFEPNKPPVSSQRRHQSWQANLSECIHEVQSAAIAWVTLNFDFYTWSSNHSQENWIWILVISHFFYQICLWSTIQNNHNQPHVSVRSDLHLNLSGAGPGSWDLRWERARLDVCEGVKGSWLLGWNLFCSYTWMIKIPKVSIVSMTVWTLNINCCSALILTSIVKHADLWTPSTESESSGQDCWSRRQCCRVRLQRRLFRSGAANISHWRFYRAGPWQEKLWMTKKPSVQPGIHSHSWGELRSIEFWHFWVWSVPCLGASTHNIWGIEIWSRGFLGWQKAWSS